MSEDKQQQQIPEILDPSSEKAVTSPELDHGDKEPISVLFPSKSQIQD